MVGHWLKVFLGLFFLMPTARATVVPQLGSEMVQRLGTGFDSGTRTFRSPCLTGEAGFAGGQRGQVQFDHQISASDLTQDLTGSFGGGVNLFLISGKAETELHSVLRNRSWRETLVFQAEVDGPLVTLQRPVLSPLGSRVEPSGDADYIALNCGNEFVSSMRLGGRLYVLVHFDFRDQSLRNDFVTRITMKVLGFRKVKTIRDSWSLADASTQVTLEARQVGGNPEWLQKILREHNTACSLDRMEPCQDVIDALYDYATGSHPGSFASQMEKMSYSHEGNNSELAVLSYQTERYQNFGFPTLAPHPIPELSGAYRQSYERLGDRLADLDSDRTRARLLLARYPQSTAAAAEIRAILDSRIMPRRDKVIRAMMQCDRNPGTCPTQEEAVAALEGELTYRPEDLYRPMGTLDYCLMSESLPGIAPLLSLLQQELGVSGCEELASRVAGLQSLSLRNRGLTSLALLADARMLDTLDASHNALTDVRALENAVRLRALNLRENRLTSLRPLEALPLESLDAAYNSLSTVGYLGRYSTLRQLNLAGNPAGDLTNLDPAAFSRLLRTEDEVCEWQRLDFLNRQMITELQYTGYRQVNFVPRLVDGDFDLKPCAVVARTLEP